MANGDDLQKRFDLNKAHKEANEEKARGNKILKEQAESVQILKNLFTSLGATITQAIDDAIEKAEGLDDVSEKIARTNERDIVGSLKKIGKTLEGNVGIQLKMLEGEDQSKQIAKQRQQIKARILQTEAAILKNEELSEDIKGEMLANLYAQGDAAEALLDGLQEQNVENLKSISLYKIAGKNLESIVNKLDDSGVLAAGLRGELDSTTFALRASEAGAASFTKIMLDGIVRISKQQTELNKEFGFSETQANKLQSAFFRIARSQEGNIALSKDIQKTFVDINTQLGIASTAFREDILGSAALLQKTMDLSGQATANLAFQAQKSGESVEDITKASIRNVLAAEKEGGIRVKIATALKEAAETTGIIRANLGFNVSAIAGAIGQARQFGMTLQQLAEISSNLLDFQSSIEAELQAELFTGKQLNLEKARLAALTGDYETLTREIAKNVGGELEFARMNVLEKQKYAAALGMSVDQMSDLVFNQGNLAELAEEARLNGEDDIYQMLMKRDIQQQFNDLMFKFQELVVGIAAGPLGRFANLMVSILNSAGGLAAVLTVIGGMQLAGIIRSVFLLTKFLGNAAKRAALMRVLTGGLKGIAMVAFAGAAVAALMSQLLKPPKETSVGDAEMEGGALVKRNKGDLRVIMNDNDSAIFGTNLFGNTSPNSQGLNSSIFLTLSEEIKGLRKDVQMGTEQSKTNTKQITDHDTVVMRSGWGAKTKFS